MSIFPGSAVLLLSWLVPAVVAASPLVVGYERFHAGRPSASGGALLFSELGCANCHGSSPVALPRRGPKLVDLKDRVRHDWLLSFLQNPEGARQGSTMPRMTHGLEAGEVEAIAAYLGSKGEGIRFQNGRHANAERGRALYHDKGCVACHAPAAGTAAESPVSLAVVFPDLKQKTSLEALNHFLSDPGQWRPDGRMPRIDLERQEAMDLAAHLIDFQPSDPGEAESVKPWPDASQILLQKGQQLVRQLNCAACHDLPGETALAPVAIDEDFEPGDQGCLSPDPKLGLPSYDFTGNQRRSLELFLASPSRKEPEREPRATLTATLQALNCYACHERDGIGGPTVASDPWFTGDPDLGAAGRIPPPLTGVGFKLRKLSLQQSLRGGVEARVRPYLETRMPSYPEHATVLADLFEKVDARADAIEITPRPGFLEAGRVLLGTEGGAGCITCHSWKGQASLGIQGPDLDALHRRLQPGWFHQYLVDPASYRPGTLMPSLWPEGRSTIPDVLGGDTEQQIGAIWTFLDKGEGLPPGFPDGRTGKFELVPGDRPLIQRTFFKEAGTKAILVGFPGGIHLAYDGQQAHPAVLWKGRFFDAYQTWFIRAAPFEVPLGDEVSKFPEPEGTGRFRGYRLDRAGNPTFLGERDGRLVEEHFSVADGRMTRTVSWSEGEAPVMTHPEGARVARMVTGKTMTIIYSWD